MIDRQEIMDFARELELDPNIIEKDYALGWLLVGISNHPQLKSSWVFKGGTGSITKAGNATTHKDRYNS